ncbi:MAG: hypothetical protein LJF30_20270 [Acidobacteria bacterium]|jgi:hypothetical protein|nr:hypothetical protein [Acidobacteriota bacterium]
MATERLLLLKRRPDPVVVSNVEDDDDQKWGRRRIRCPRCAWEPDRDDLWACLCLHSWNTFDTGGRCPACGRQWTETQCLRCKGWSPHADWYGGEEI